MGVESLNEKAVTYVTGALRFNSSSAVTVLNKISNSPSVFRKGYFFMTDVLILVVKVFLIAAFAVFIGKKTGLFSLSKVFSFIALVLLLLFCSAELYSSFFRDDISLLISFNSPFWSFTADLSFGLRVFLITLLLGMVSSVLGVGFSMKIDSVQALCTLALLIAIAVLLSIYATFRVGSAIKIPFKFIAVFITAAVFGPLWGGCVGALSDIIAFMINPVGGAFIPQITMVEFLYGFTYGLFFYNSGSWGGFKTMIKIITCVVFQIVVLNLGLTTYFLVPLMGMSFDKLLIMRAVSGVINMAIQLVAISVMSKYIIRFKKTLK